MGGGGFGGGYSNPVAYMPTNLQNYIGGTGSMGQQDNMGGGGSSYNMSSYSQPTPMFGGSTGGYRGAWPGQGYGGYPGRFMGGYRQMGPSNYGFGGGGFGYGGFSPWGYGPGSYSPWSAGSMGYGGGSGMMGGPSRFFTGFSPQNWASQQAGAGSEGPTYTPFSPSAFGGAGSNSLLSQLQNALAQIKNIQRYDRDRGNQWGGGGGPRGSDRGPGHGHSGGELSGDGPGGLGGGPGSASGGVGGDPKILCTTLNDMYGFGSFRNAAWMAYAKKNPDKYLTLGYHKIFAPLARRMPTSPRLTKVLQRIVRQRTNRVRREMRGKTPTFEQRLYQWGIEPALCAIGWLIDKGIVKKYVFDD